MTWSTTKSKQLQGIRKYRDYKIEVHSVSDCYIFSHFWNSVEKNIEVDNYDFQPLQ